MALSYSSRVTKERSICLTTIICPSLFCTLRQTPLIPRPKTWHTRGQFNHTIPVVLPRGCLREGEHNLEGVGAHILLASRRIALVRPILFAGVRACGRAAFFARGCTSSHSKSRSGMALLVTDA